MKKFFIIPLLLMPLALPAAGKSAPSTNDPQEQTVSVQDLEDLNKLADKYYFGHGVPQDYEKAVEWYRKAADKGNSDAQCNLGYCYHYGQGVPRDYEKAVEWYRKAADQGNAQAQFNLG